MSRFLIAVLVVATFGSRGLAQVLLSVSLDPGPPAGVVTADIFANAAVTDAWAACGIRAVAMSGATFRYGGEDDLNSPYPDFIIAPYGSGPVTDPHVTSLSRPRAGRNSPNRFNSNAGADLFARYSPSGAVADVIASETELNVVWFGNPYPGPSSPSEDGYICRISLNASVPVGATLGTGRLDTVPTEATIIMLSDNVAGETGGEYGVSAATFDMPIYFGFDWAVWYEQPCVGDLDDSGAVDLNDLTVLLSHFGMPASASEGDLDGSGLVDLDDLVVLLSNFGLQCG